MDDHNINRQQASDETIYRWTFRDFITPNPQSFVHVTGHKATLDALDFVLSSGACVHHPLDSDSIYSHILTAINHVCNTFSALGCVPVTIHDLVSIQLEPWFQDLLDRYASRHHLSDGVQLTDNGKLTGDGIAVLLEALSFAQITPEMELGVVSSITAWVVVDTRFGGSELYGIGSSTPQAQQQGLLGDSDEINNDETTEDDTEEPLDVRLTERRKTAAHVVAQQTPLPANLTATDILTNHKDRLQYSNMLKVALMYSNQKIAEECQTNQSLKQPSGVVKRINTALAWVEREFDISAGALRAAFDEERKINGIVVRGKENPVDGATVAGDDDKIQAAMGWIKTGGPRP